MNDKTRDSEWQYQPTSEASERDRRLARVLDAADSVNTDDFESIMSLTQSVEGSSTLPRSIRAGSSKLTSAMSSSNPSVIYGATEMAASRRDRVPAFDVAKVDSLIDKLQELRDRMTEYQRDSPDFSNV